MGRRTAGSERLGSIAMRVRTSWRHLRSVFALVLLAQLPLILNPGYFSHDELQWAASRRRRARVWLHWTAIERSEYRPLDLQPVDVAVARSCSRSLRHSTRCWWRGARPMRRWSVVLSRRFGMASGPAFTGALVFALGPYASYVHGWIGTLGDLVWLSCALLCARSRLRQPRAWLAGVAPRC